MPAASAAESLRRPRAPRPADPSLTRIAWLMAAAGRYVPVGATCLTTALVLSWVLVGRAIATALRIGACLAVSPGGTAYAVIVDPGRLVRQLRLATRLATAVPICSVSFPRSLARLRDVRDAIFQDLGT